MNAFNKQLFTQITHPAKRKVVYVAPETKVVDLFAREVCQQLQKRGHSMGEEADVMNGLAAFLNCVARATAQHLNKSNEIKQGG